MIDRRRYCGICGALMIAVRYGDWRSPYVTCQCHVCETCDYPEATHGATHA